MNGDVTTSDPGQVLRMATVGFAHTAFRRVGSGEQLIAPDPSTPTYLYASGIPPLLMTKLARGSGPHMSQEEQPAYRDR
jgi:hypothetical protein